MEDTNNKCTDITVFYPISLAAEFEVRIQTAQGMSDGGSYGQILINKSVN